MGWPSKYNGPQIDEALERGRGIRIVNNGWIRLESSNESPTNLGDHKNPGNYTTAFWTDGPDLGDISASPLNFSVISLNGDIYQFATIAGNTYSRVMTSEETNYGSWSIDQTSGAINPGATAPAAPVDGKTLWLDTSNVEAATLKLYVNGEWQEVIPEAVMQASVYDPQGKKSDIFKFIEDTIAAASLGSISDEVEAHIEDSSIHATEEEKTKWNAAATTTDIDNAVAEIKSELLAEVESVVSADIEKVDSLTESVGELQTSIDEHIADETIHPTAEMQANWDSKSDGDHTHNLDGRVIIDADHIDGEIPFDKLPYDVKERVYEVETLAELYALQKDPIHNGDAVYVKANNGWYFVVDDTYLGAEGIDTIWTEVTESEMDRKWRSICYGNFKYIAVANDSNVFAYSDDGVTWTEVTVGDINKSWHSVYYGHCKYIAIPYNSNVFVYSYDGITWNEVTVSDTAREWISVCYGNDKYVAIAYGTVFAYSYDGITWNEVTVSDTSRNWRSVCYGNDKFVTIAHSSNVFAYSYDGVTWTEVTVGEINTDWYSVCYGNGKYVAISSDTGISAYSDDGITWTEGIVNETVHTWKSVCYSNDKFVAVANSSNIFAYSYDGITWSEARISTLTRHWESICYGNDKFVAVAYDSNIFAYSTLLTLVSQAFKKFHSATDINWSDVTETPTTLAGYGITDAATPADIAKLQTKIEDVQESVDSGVDLTGLQSVQTLYNSAVSNLKAIDNVFSSMDAAITKIESIIS